MEAYGLTQHRDWGVFEGNGALVAFANPIEPTPMVDNANPFLPTIQNAPATLVLRRRLQNQRPVADSIRIATTMFNGTGTPKILAASYEAPSGNLERVNISTGQSIQHQGIKAAPTTPEEFISQAGFVTARMVAETGHHHLANIIHSDDLGVGIVGDIHNRVSQQLGLELRSKDGFLSIQIEDSRFSVPTQI